MVWVVPIKNKLSANIYTQVVWACTGTLVDAMVRKSDMIVVNKNIIKGKGRPKLTSDVIVKKNMNILNLIEHIFL